MEDAHTTLLKLGDTGACFFGVYDGHGGKYIHQDVLAFFFFNELNIGSTIAQYTGQILHEKLLESPHFKAKEYPEALKDAFLNVDKSLLEGKSTKLFTKQGLKGLQ